MLRTAQLDRVTVPAALVIPYVPVANIMEFDIVKVPKVFMGATTIETVLIVVVADALLFTKL